MASGIWPLYRYNPALAAEGKNPLVIDSKDPTVPVQDYAYNETRYRMLVQSDEARRRDADEERPGGRCQALGALQADGSHAV